MEPTVPRMTVMRHSVRLDGLPDHHPHHHRFSWSDRSTRPHDPPIIDFTLPASQAELWSIQHQLSEDFLQTVRIIVSPLRRCLATSTILANTLGISKLTVHYGVAEQMYSVDACGERTGPLFLTEEQQLAVVRKFSETVSIESFTGTHPPRTEEDGLHRYISTFAEIEAAYPNENILIVTHGHALQAVVTHYLGDHIVVHDVEECAWISFDSSGHLLYHSRIDMLTDDG